MHTSPIYATSHTTPNQHDTGPGTQARILLTFYTLLVVATVADIATAALDYARFDQNAFWALSENQHYRLLRLALLAIFIAAICTGIAHLCAWLARRIFTHWWDPASKPDGPLNWAQVLALTSTDNSFDPIHYRRQVRWGYLLRLTPAIVVIGLAGFFVTLIVVDFILHPRVPLLLHAGTTENHVESPASIAHMLNVSGNLTAYLALLASLVTIAFTYHQLRAKVRADNRKKWIETLRKKLSFVISILIKISYSKNKKTKTALIREMDKARMELEMLLNPAERDHRILLYLIHQPIFIEPLKVADYANVHNDLCNLFLIDPRIEEMRTKLVGTIPLRDRISHILRLSHVVLKREWERVKHTR